jgi:hypothetical protein
MADPAGLDGDEDLAGSRIRHLDGLYRDRFTLGSCDDGLNDVRHG